MQAYFKSRQIATAVVVGVVVSVVPVVVVVVVIVEIVVPLQCRCEPGMYIYRCFVVAVVGITLTPIIKSVVTGQGPVTLELRNTPGKKAQTQGGTRLYLKVIAGRVSDYYERENILPGKQCGFKPQRSTVDVMFIVRRLQKLAQKKDTSSYLCSIDLMEAYDSINRTLLRDVLARLGVPPRMLAVIRTHDGLQACVRLDDGECSDMFDVGQGVRQGCVLAPLLFNMFFTAVLRVAEKRFIADEAVTDNMVQLQRMENSEKKGTSRTSKVNRRRGKEGRRCRYSGVCCTRTMGASYRDHPKGWRG